MAKKAATKSTPKTEEPKVQPIAEELLTKLGVEANVSLQPSEELLQFQIETAEPALLIGYHGDTLNALQRILGLMIEKKTGSWKKLTVNVGDYRERREETLKHLALATAQRVKFSGEPMPLPSLSPAERRIVHSVLNDHPDVFSESEGEGATRRLVIKPRQK